jgi:hypothetical protein
VPYNYPNALSHEQDTDFTASIAAYVSAQACMYRTFVRNMPTLPLSSQLSRLHGINSISCVQTYLLWCEDIKSLLDTSTFSAQEWLHDRVIALHRHQELNQAHSVECPWICPPRLGSHLCLSQQQKAKKSSNAFALKLCESTIAQVAQLSRSARQQNVL